MKKLDFLETVIDHYPFEGNARDSFGLEREVVNGATLCDGVDGRPKSAYEFDNPNQEIVMYRNHFPNKGETTKKMSVSWWANTPEEIRSIQYSHFFSQHTNTKNENRSNHSFRGLRTGPSAIYDRFHRDRILFLWLDTQERRHDLFSRNIPSINEWHHYCATFDSDEEKRGRLYMDGNLEAEIVIDRAELSIDFECLCLGDNDPLDRNTFGTSESYRGKIGEIIIFHKSLTEEEVKYLYEQRGNTKFSPNHDDVLNRVEAMMKHSDLKVELENKTLSLWKPLFLVSENEDVLKGEKCDILKSLSLNVEESVILLLLLNRISKTDTILSESNVLDYFLFFHGLGMKNGVDNIIQWLTSFPYRFSFRQLFHLFQSCAKSHESESVKMFLSSEKERKKVPLSFTTRFCETLFQIMKKRKDEATLLGKEGENFAINLSSTVPLMKKDDEEEEDEGEICVIRGSILQKAFELCDETGDLSLVTSDGYEFKCHRIILLLNSNFFHSMVNFGGSETLEMQKTNRIKLDVVDGHTLKVLLRLYYHVNVESIMTHLADDALSSINQLSTLLKAAIHCHAYLEKDNFDVVKKTFIRMSKKIDDKDRIELTIRKIGPLLFGNDELVETFSRWLEKGCDFEVTEEEIWRWVGESNSEKRYKMLEKENEALRKRMDKMEENLMKFGEMVERLSKKE